MREEQFRLQARRLDTFFAEKIGAFFYRFADGHAGSLSRRAPVGKSKALALDEDMHIMFHQAAVFPDVFLPTIHLVGKQRFKRARAFLKSGWPVMSAGCS